MDQETAPSLTGYAAHQLQLLEAILNRMPTDPCFIKNAALRYVAANDAMATLCGLPHRSLIVGRSARDLFSFAQARRFETWDRHVMSTRRPLTQRVDLVASHNAEPRWLIFSRLPVPDADGRSIGVAAVAKQLAADDPRATTLQRLAIAMEDIRDRATGQLDLPAVARRARLSVAQLQRDFRRHLGITPRDLHLAARIEQALELLEGEDSIAVIAYRCGFSDQSAFSRCFRRITGTSPSAYRAARRRERRDL
jgi:AraC-like DNA-binding protein